MLYCLFQGVDHCSGAFLFCNSSCFYGCGASVVPLGKCVVAEAGCNWYLPDINICSFPKKMKVVLNSVQYSTGDFTTDVGVHMSCVYD